MAKLAERLIYSKYYYLEKAGEKCDTNLFNHQDWMLYNKQCHYSLVHLDFGFFYYETFRK